MNVNINYGLVLTILTILSSGTQWYDPVAAEIIVRDNAIDVREELLETEMLIEAEEAIIDEIHREWKLCLESDKPRIECNALYETMLRVEKPLTRMMHYHALLEEVADHQKHCRSKRSKQECISDKRDRERRTATMKSELYPWLDIYELCMAELPRKKCYDILQEMQIKRYIQLVPDSLVTIAKAHICIDAGRSEEQCEREAMDHYEQVVAPKVEL